MNGTTPNYLAPKKKRDLRLKCARYQLIDGVFSRKKYNNVLLRCLEKHDVERVLVEMHDGPVGGHFGGENTTHKVLHVGYYWPSLFKDAYPYARKCKKFSTSAWK